jgi:hypothetical protein
MRRLVPAGFLMAVGLLVWGCQQDESEEKIPRQVMVLDKQSRPGRVFMYIDDQGEVVRTRHYRKIPLDKRNTVVVLEGHKRARITRASGGGVSIQALPPVIGKTEEQLGEAEAKALLKAAPPEEGPPSTEKWTDEQWRQELRRELLELREEEEKNP